MKFIPIIAYQSMDQQNLFNSNRILLFAIIACALFFLMLLQQEIVQFGGMQRERVSEDDIVFLRSKYDELQKKIEMLSDSSGSASQDNWRKNPPPNLPSLGSQGMTEEEVKKVEKDRMNYGYGGGKEQQHLGGFTANDTMGQSPALWEWMLKGMNVKTFIDVGCGRGISTKWFLDHNAEVLCVEGSHEAVMNSLLPKEFIVEHDFYRGPWWPSKTYDVAWAVEFLEHVGRHKMDNYINIFKSAAVSVVTYSTWGGWHHVEVHPDGLFWRNRFAAHGFVYLDQLTQKMKSVAPISKDDGFNAQHLWTHLLVFAYPPVAGLPQHRHLFGGPGCFTGKDKDPLVNCAGKDELPEEFYPVWNKASKYDISDIEVLGMHNHKQDEKFIREHKEN